MARAVCITNPRAASTAPEAVEVIRREFERAGWSLDVVTGNGPSETRRLAAEALVAGAERVLVYGGDGTAMQAAAALVGSGVPLGLIPGGTGNLLAGNLRIPRRPDEAARALLSGHEQTIDLGRVERADGDHYFAVSAGAGFDAVVMRETTAESKRQWGMLAYVGTIVRYAIDVTAAAHTIVVDGKATEVKAAMVLVANCPELVPGWIRLGADIRFDDGCFDVLVADADSIMSAAAAAWELCTQGPASWAPRVARLRGEVVEVRACDQRPVQLDGEPLGVTPLVATVVRGALTVLVP